MIVVARTDELAASVLADATAGAVEPEDPSGEHTDISFWNQARHLPRETVRSVATPSWQEIRSNYAANVAASFDRVVSMQPDHLAGQLMLLHGPPGTGKTTALRALAREWRAWCRVQFVIDPDELFRSSEYLMHVALGDDDDERDPDAGRRWRLLVLEDCDELIRVDAKSSQGQALARLLNVTDGVVGQSLRLLICISTNEELARLHPAVTRPGRCFSQLHVGPMSRPEAVRWLGTERGVGPVGATLAELFALRAERAQVCVTRPDEAVGLYV